MAHDLPAQRDDLERRLSALGIRLATPGTPGGRELATGAVALPADVAAALEEVRHAVGALAEIQGRLYALRRLKERLDRLRPLRTPER